MTFGRPTAICTYLAPITSDGLKADVIEVESKLLRARECYREKRAEYRKRVPSCTDTEIEVFERGGRGREDMSELRAVLGQLSILERHLENVRQVAKLLRPTPAKLRVMVVEAGDLASDLRERGYRFERDGYWSDPFGVHARSAFCKRVLADDVSLGLLAVELVVLGIEIQMDGQLSEAVASVKYKMSQVVGP
jgi:hypothetical protein